MKAKKTEKRNIYRIAIAILLITLLFAIGGNIVLYKFAYATYRRVNNLSLDPISLDHFLHTPIKTIPDNQKIVLFFGDSRAEQWVSPTHSPTFTFINRGIASQTSAQVLARFDAHVTPIQPDIIVLQVCINDLKTIPLFPKRKQQIIDHCQDNIAKIIAKSKAIGAKIIVTTVMPAGKIPLARRLVWSDDVGLAITEVNTFIRALDEVIILDSWAMVADNAGILRPTYATDTLHLNPTGYNVLNQKLETLLQTLPR